MREVAEHAGVTKPLIHYYFGSKEELFATLLRESLTACRAAQTEVQTQHSSPREQLRALLRWQFERARRTPEVVAFAHEVMNAPAPLPVGFDYRAEGRALCATYVQLVEAGQAQGEFRAVDPQAVVVMMAATVRAYVSAVLSGDIEAIPDGVEDTVFDLVVHGVGMPAPAPAAPFRLEDAS